MHIKNILILSIILYLYSCKVYSRKQKAAEVQKENWEVSCGEGIGQILLHRTSKKDLEKTIGKGKKFKYYDTLGKGKWVPVYSFPELGLELLFGASDTLRYISIVPPCDFKTKEGIDIGSSRKEIENLYGKPSSTYSTSHVLFSQGSGIDDVIFQEICYDEKKVVFMTDITSVVDSMDAKVVKILLW